VAELFLQGAELELRALENSIGYAVLFLTLAAIAVVRRLANLTPRRRRKSRGFSLKRRRRDSSPNWICNYICSIRYTIAYDLERLAVQGDGEKGRVEQGDETTHVAVIVTLKSVGEPFDRVYVDGL
jgi:hypothetical protein